ncbi:hypothetical protein SLEP1_g21358 [Rubroshorea leprosula]|uniref:Transposase n=1 Tax=Rubroshorea leprosula TaxID=152421 RepID=A0AAV5JHP6_9ROSI|nr:hypothetical protein SLEP1_g21358 [Rubroshorea leprosula]
MDAYSVWWARGETLSNNVDPWLATSDVASSSNIQEHVNIEEHVNAEDDIHHMVYDAFCPSENDHPENVGDAPNRHAQSFYDLLHASTIPLGPSSNNQTLLGWLSYMLHCKAKNNITGVGYNDIIQGCRQLLSPEDQQKYGDEAKSLTACPVCGEPRYKKCNSVQTQKKGRPRNSLWYLPIIPHLQRLYMSRKTAEHMTWHFKCRVDSEILIHPAQSTAWKHFDVVHPSFASDPRNVRLGLATDGFNLWSHSSRSYSCWPVFIVVYNLPPEMCMRPEFTFLTLIISGPKSPGKNIDVFLRPLIDDLKRLWLSGVETFDSFHKQNFTMRAMLMWTITNFPGYGMVSGWSTHGRLSCTHCMEMTRAFYLQHGRKICFFDCHRQFLPASHSYRMDASQFLKGQLEFGPPPPRLDGHFVRLRVAALPDVLFGNPSVNQTIPGFGETHNWVKRSIFWELSYWGDNLIRHNLDVMHCEKNFFDKIIHTVMNDSSSKDNVKSRMDLPLYCDREELHLYYDSFGPLCMPNASYALDTDKKRCLCTWLKNVRFPDGFASNIARCVNLAELRLVGLKSHDCHIFMQRLIPIAFCGLMSGGPINSAHSRSTSGRRGRHNSVDLACDVTPVLDVGHTRSISPQGSIHAAASSHNEKQKGRGPNKPKRAARRADERPFIQISHKGTFLDVEVPRLITTLWKRVYDGDYFTYDLFPEQKRLQVWELFKTHYQWGLEDEDAVRKAFLRSMKEGWGDNMKDERDKWRANGEYRPVWVPEHLWPTLCAYWNSAEFHNLSERGKKNRASGERVTHTTRSVSFDVHEERMVNQSCWGGKASTPRAIQRKHILYEKVSPKDKKLHGVATNIRLGMIHTSMSALLHMARTQHHGHLGTMTLRQLLLGDATAISCQELVHREAMQMMRDEIGQVKEQREAMQRMLEDMGRMQASLSQQFAAFSAYGMRPPTATPSLPHTGQAFLPVGTSFPTAGPSFHASGPSFPHAMPMQMPREPAFPMGQMGRQSGSPGTSSANPPQDDYGYQPRFDADYQGPFGPE